MTEENKLKYVSNWYLFIPFFGLVFPDILSFFGIINGRDAVTYYGDIHKNHTNKILHMTLLPFAAYGYALGVPALFKLSYDDAALIRNWFYITFIIHYYSINAGITAIFAIIYFFPLYFAHIHYKPTFRIALEGIGIGTSLMIVMEYIGHTLFEIDNSRPEGVLNAIFYSHFFITEEWVRLIYMPGAFTN